VLSFDIFNPTIHLNVVQLWTFWFSHTNAKTARVKVTIVYNFKMPSVKGFLDRINPWHEKRMPPLPRPKCTQY
jgi:hypothetical protein